MYYNPMNTLKSIAVLLLLVACCLDVNAQDPRFSQLFSTPLQNNPAWTGLFGGKFRAIANYRELYTSVLNNRPFRTLAASVDAKFGVGRNDYWGLGGWVQHDQVGDARFNRFDAMISASYMKKVKGNRYGGAEHFLIAGVQAGVGQQGFDFEQLWFTNQFDQTTGQIDFDAPNGENFNQTRSNLYPNINAGLLWYSLFDVRTNFYAGATIQHLTQPDISMIEDSESKLAMRWIGQLGGQVPFGKYFSLEPSVLASGQDQSLSILGGTQLRYGTADYRELGFSVGAYAHLANKLESGILMDAIVLALKLELERVMIGLSYDFTTSTLSQANNSRGAFEISLIYVQPDNRANQRRKQFPRF